MAARGKAAPVGTQPPLEGALLRAHPRPNCARERCTGAGAVSYLHRSRSGTCRRDLIGSGAVHMKTGRGCAFYMRRRALSYEEACTRLSGQSSFDRARTLSLPAGLVHVRRGGGDRLQCGVHVGEREWRCSKGVIDDAQSVAWRARGACRSAGAGTGRGGAERPEASRKASGKESCRVQRCLVLDAL